jgi:hypothetical protein
MDILIWEIRGQGSSQHMHIGMRKLDNLDLGAAIYNHKEILDTWPKCKMDIFFVGF